MNLISPMNQDNLTDKLIRELEEKIINGTLKIGDKLPAEQELAEQAGIGRRAIREALNALRLKGLVETRKGSGTIVIRNDLNNFLDNMITNVQSYLKQNKAQLYHVLEFRRIVTRSAIEFLISSYPEEVIRKLKENLAVQKESFWEKNSKGYDAAHKEFHITLVESLNNPLISMFHVQALQLLTKPMKQSSEALIVTEASIREHEDIINAIENRDLEEALNALDRHLSRAQENLRNG